MQNDYEEQLNICAVLLEEEIFLIYELCTIMYCSHICTVAGSRPGRYIRICMVPQSVRYHKLPPSSVLQPETGQATWRVGSTFYV